MVMTFWHQRNVFVTGATGLLGSWLVEALVAQKANVTCLVRDWVPNSRLNQCGLHERVNLVRGDLADFELLVRALNEYEINTVFHLGAQAIVGVSSRSALSTFDSNIGGTWTLLEACRSLSKLVERVIVASSDKAYGSQDRLPYTEDMPLQGRYPYDVSKSCADLIALSYYHTYRLPLAITRCGNLYGGGDLNFNRLIPGTIRSALQDSAPVIRSNGKYIRDYVYVRDAVEAYLRLAEALPNEQIVGQAFNIGPELPLSVIAVVERLLQLMGKTRLTPVILNEADHEIYAQYLDCTKARERLNWQPQYSIDAGLLETIDWYRGWLNTLQ